MAVEARGVNAGLKVPQSKGANREIGAPREETPSRRWRYCGGRYLNTRRLRADLGGGFFYFFDAFLLLFLGKLLQGRVHNFGDFASGSLLFGWHFSRLCRAEFSRRLRDLGICDFYAGRG